jgi:hypothetical protein
VSNRSALTVPFSSLHISRAKPTTIIHSLGAIQLRPDSGTLMQLYACIR